MKKKKKSVVWKSGEERCVMDDREFLLISFFFFLLFWSSCSRRLDYLFVIDYHVSFNSAQQSWACVCPRSSFCSWFLPSSAKSYLENKK